MSDKTNQIKTRGVHHVGLTVTDLDEARRFFLDTLGYQQVGEKPDYPAVFVSDEHTMITLWQATDASAAIPFDRKNVVGLHHLALAVQSNETLNALCAELKTNRDVTIEFEPEDLGGGPKRHMMCYIPGCGIRVEFIAA